VGVKVDGIEEKRIDEERIIIIYPEFPCTQAQLRRTHQVSVFQVVRMQEDRSHTSV